MKNNVVLSSLISLCAVFSLSAYPEIGSRVDFNAKTVSGEKVSLSSLKSNKCLVVVSSPSNKEFSLKALEDTAEQLKQSVPGGNCDCFLILPNGVKVKGTSNKFKTIIDSKGTLIKSINCPSLLSALTVYIVLLDEMNEVRGVMVMSDKGVERLDMSGLPGGFRMI